MHSCTVAFSILAASAVWAAPAPQATSDPIQRTANFGIVNTVNGPYRDFVLRAEPSDESPSSRYLVFEDPTTASPSPAYLSGTASQLDRDENGFAYLNFVNDATNATQDFGAWLPDIGDGPGFLDSIFVGLGLANPAWTIGDNQLFGQLQAAPNTLLSCPTTVNSTNTTATVLMFGNMNDQGSYGPGCVYASLETVWL